MTVNSGGVSNEFVHFISNHSFQIGVTNAQKKYAVICICIHTCLNIYLCLHAWISIHIHTEDAQFRQILKLKCI